MKRLERLRMTSFESALTYRTPSQMHGHMHGSSSSCFVGAKFVSVQVRISLNGPIRRIMDRNPRSVHLWGINDD